ncbi:MAG TPA: hypothetical protein PLW97_03060, partial [Synergistaceae bacterium]|nr:hypothetical protein [Synergistaceae bacterium]
RDISRKEEAPRLEDLREASEDESLSPPEAALSSDQGVTPDMMERLLHRLHDLPGEALIPRGAYENVEKDW